MALSDQRRAFSEDFYNIVLAETPVYAEIARHHRLTDEKRLNISELRNFPCILVAPSEYQEKEAEYYCGLLGFKGQFLFAESLDAARMMASSGRGFLLSQGSWKKSASEFDLTVQIPLFKSGQLIRERFCAFYLKEKETKLIQSFVQTLENEFKSVVMSDGGENLRSDLPKEEQSNGSMDRNAGNSSIELPAG